MPCRPISEKSLCFFLLYEPVVRHCLWIHRCWWGGGVQAVKEAPRGLFSQLMWFTCDVCTILSLVLSVPLQFKSRMLLHMSHSIIWHNKCHISWWTVLVTESHSVCVSAGPSSKPRHAFQMKDSCWREIACPYFQILRSVLWFFYWASVSQRHFRYHWICWVIKPKRQDHLHHSLCPTLRLLLLWNPLQTGSFIHYLIIGLGQHIQIWYSFSLKYKKFYQALRLFLCSGSAKYSQLFSLYRGYPHLPQTTAPLTTYLCGRSLNFHEFYVTSLWQACAF